MVDGASALGILSRGVGAWYRLGGRRIQSGIAMGETIPAEGDAARSASQASLFFGATA